MNICTFIGNLTKDATTKTRQDGTTYLMFTIAVNEVKGQEKRAFYVTCFVTHYSPNLIQYLRKGTKVGVSGAISPSAYIAPDGQARPDLALSTLRVELCGQGNQQGEAQQAQYPQQPQQGYQQQATPQPQPQQAPPRQADMFAPPQPNANNAMPPSSNNGLPF